jgi:hypothetical protein
MAGKRKAALVRMKRVVEQAKATLVIAAPAERSRRDKAAVDKWIYDRVPIIVGQTWLTIANDGISARFAHGR